MLKSSAPPLLVTTILLFGCAEGSQNGYIDSDSTVSADLSLPADLYSPSDFSVDGSLPLADLWAPPDPDTLAALDAQAPQDLGSSWDIGTTDATSSDSSTPDASTPCPDQHESNASCGTGTPLGSTLAGTTWISETGTLDPESDTDWYWAEGKESSSFCVPGTSQCFIFSVRLEVPDGRMFRLCVQEGPCSATPTCQENAVIPGPMQLNVQYQISGTCALTDDTTARILVEQLDGSGGCAPYTISVNYDSC